MERGTERSTRAMQTQLVQLCFVLPGYTVSSINIKYSSMGWNSACQVVAQVANAAHGLRSMGIESKNSVSAEVHSSFVKMHVTGP